MKVVVDRALCENHGQCALIAEDVFRMNDEGVLEYESDPDESHRDDVEEAADLCPVQAILVSPA
jgi:ferredoxin